MKRVLLYLLLLLPLQLLAQKRAVTGTVVAEDDGMGLPGVSVVIKGTAKGTITDLNGKFKIQVKDSDILVISFIGMETQETTVKSKSELNIRLKASVERLDEVVVSAGYFDIKKSDVTGSIARVGSETLEQVRVNSVESMLAGRVAGVVVKNSGEPGGGIDIAIRGTNSMTGGTQPLYVVDGIPIDPVLDAEGNGASTSSQSSLSFLNPNDIESVNILKDAGATAIYGARGANGVVVITTKEVKGAKGFDSFTAVAEVYLSQVARKVDVLDGASFEQYLNQRAINGLYKTITNPNVYEVPFDGTQDLTADNFSQIGEFTLPYPETTGINTDWQEKIYEPAVSKSYNVAYRGGTKRSNASISLGFLDNQGIITNSEFSRMTLNMSLRKSAFNDKITILSKTNGSYAKGTASSAGNGQFFNNRGVVSNAMIFQPIFEELADGETDDVYQALNDDNPSNPYTLATSVDDIKTTFTANQAFTLMGNITDNLSASAKTAINYQKSFRDTYYPTTTVRGRRNNGEASRSYLQNIKSYSEANLRYQKSFGKHHTDVILLGTYEHKVIDRSITKAYGFPSDKTTYENFGIATNVLNPVFGESPSVLLSGVFRVGYNFNKKYFVDVNGRVDSSSRLAKKHRTQFFPSVSLAWNISNEDFLKKSSTINNMKLRASYGRIGNDAIPPFLYEGMMGDNRYSFDGKQVIGYYEDNLENENLKWETTEQFNAGLDMSFMKNRLNFTADVYYKKTYDLLQFVKIPSSSGYSQKMTNFGQVDNQGIELTLSYDILNKRKKGLNWNVTGTFAMNRNMLVKLNEGLSYQLGPTVGPSGQYPSIFMEGKPLGVFWGAETDGIYANWEEALASGIQGATPGEINYVNHHVDYNEDGQPSDVQAITFDDYKQIGDPNPDFVYSINSSFRYKNFDFSFLITGQQGGDILWVDSWNLTNMAKSKNVLASAFADAWKAPLSVDAEGALVYDPSVGNTENALHPAPFGETGQRALIADRQVYDGTFVKLQNVNIGYTIKLKSKKRSLRVYASGSNLFTISDYPGYEPNVQTFNSNPQKRGIDFGAYPATRTYMVGLKFNY